MRQTGLILLFIISFFSLHSQITTIESHMMGHSLIDHETATEQTAIAHWIDQFSDEAGLTYETTGQFGSIWQFADFNPASNWGYMGVTSSWNDDSETFEGASLNNFMYTIFNFVQDLPSNVPYYTEPVSVLEASERLIDSVDTYQPDVTVFIYENWPDMGTFTTEPFDPTSVEFQAYNAYTTGGFHDWWVDLQDFLLASRPSENVRMIPAGPMIAELMSVAPYDTIAAIDLYEDNAPHGRESIYFLAGLATYMAFYEVQAPLTYVPPTTIHPAIRDNYASIVSTFWTYLQNFNDDQGNSRVFSGSTPPPNDADNDNIVDTIDNCPNVANPDQADYDMDGIGDLCDTITSQVIVDQGVFFSDNPEGILMRGRDNNCYLLYIDASGILRTEQRPCAN